MDDKCQVAFDELKAILKSSPVLSAPNFELDFKLAVDASDSGIGGMLFQEDENNIEHPVAYFSKKFNKHQKNYSTIEKECLALILAIEHFEIYVSSCKNPIMVYSDHNPLKFISRMKNKNQRLMRWNIYLQRYNIIVNYVRGKDNIIPDTLS